MMPRRQVVVIPDTARRPAWRPPAYRPPAPPPPLRLGASELGEGPNINLTNIGETIMFAAFGAGAMYAAPLFPDPAKSIGMVVGVGLIGYAAYTLLGKTAPKPPSPGSGDVTGQPPAPPLSEINFKLLNGSIISPISGSKPKLNTWSLTNNFDVVVSWYNGADKAATSPYDIVADAVIPGGVPILGENWIRQVVAAKSVSNLEVGVSTQVAVPIPLIRPPKTGPTGGNPSPQVYLFLQLRKIYAKDGTAVPVGGRMQYGPFDLDLTTVP